MMPWETVSSAAHDEPPRPHAAMGYRRVWRPWVRPACGSNRAGQAAPVKQRRPSARTQDRQPIEDRAGPDCAADTQAVQARVGAWNRLGLAAGASDAV